jgi:multidrug resistance efflux pump
MLNISKDKIEKNHSGLPLTTLNTLSTPQSGRVLARWILGIAIFLFFCLFLPWQQNINGTGSVTALTPQDRPQTIHSAIPGRIVEWRIQEGQFVNAGDTLVVLAEIKDEYFDPEILIRLQEQLTAKKQSIEATKDQIVAINKQLEALKDGLNFSLQKMRNKVIQARLKVISDSMEYEANKVDFNIADIQFKRYKTLFETDGLISQTDFERRKLKLQETSAKMISGENKFLASQNELLNARIELSSIQADYGDKISKAEAELGAKQSYLAEAESDFSKLTNKYASVRVRIDNYHLIAPQDGYIVKALRTGIGETIKEGEPVLTIQPDSPSMAVELYVRAMDVPLISKGRKVRLEFDGWPALQFSGWPSVSVGTFGGEVAVIDYVNSPSGEYRILVIPDPEEPEPWPKQLRLGSGVYGWVMLDDVPVWFELWRQLNGFPPSLKSEPGAPGAPKPKK